MKYLFLLLSLFLFGCNQNKSVQQSADQNTEVQAQSQTNETIEESGLPEDFKTFYPKFLKEESFQLSRINFPLEGEIVEEGLEVSPIQKKDWNMLQGSVYEVDRNEYKVEIQEDSTEVYHRIYIEDSGVDIGMRYKRIEGKWYLIYYRSIFI